MEPTQPPRPGLPLMSISRLGLGLLALALLTLAPSPAAAPRQERKLADAELAPVAERFAAYFAARRDARSVADTRAELEAGLDGLRAASGIDLLASPADLSRAVWLSRGTARQKLRAGVVVEERFDGGRFAERPFELAYRLPKPYDAELGAYPLILVVPEEGEAPAAHLRAAWTHRPLLDGAILVAVEMPPKHGDWTRVTVDGRPGGLSHVLTGLRLASERFAIDFDRIFVCGYGKGVPAALAAGNHSPQRFAGVLGRSGDAGDLTPANFENLPTWLAGGGSHAREFFESSEAADFGNCSLVPAGTEVELWEWVQRTRRTPRPTRLSLAIGDPFPTRVNWLRVAPTAPDARAVASIDREKNTVNVHGNGFSHATLTLDDGLVDLSRPVRVVCNGVARTVQLERSLSTVLDLLSDGTSDPGCVAVAQGTFVMALDGGPVTQAANARARDSFGSPACAARLEAAAGDPEALWSLALACAADGRAREQHAALARLLALDPDHAGAREALGFAGAPGRWFSSEEAERRYLERQVEANAIARGLVQRKGEWMHSAHRALAAKGRTRDLATGLWLTGAERKQLERGWVRQDLEWVAPEDAPHVADGLWLVEGAWLELAAANARHASLDTMWRIPTPEVLLDTTVDRETAEVALVHMARAIDDVRRVLGAEPALPVEVVLLRDEEQYETFAIGDPEGEREAAHAERLHVVHSAFYAESWFPLADGERVFRGAGVGFWDALHPYGAAYGLHSARLAAALAYVNALDPSPKAVRSALSGGPDREFAAAFEAEKELPAWLRYGAAVYAERFFRDDHVPTGGAPWWARDWSLQNLERLGGLRSLDEVLAFELDPDDREDGLRRLLEVGFVAAFLVDGGCPPVDEAQNGVRRALAEGRLEPSHVAALEKALRAHETELRAFPVR